MRSRSAPHASLIADLDRAASSGEALRVPGAEVEIREADVGGPWQRAAGLQFAMAPLEHDTMAPLEGMR